MSVRQISASMPVADRIAMASSIFVELKERRHASPSTPGGPLGPSTTESFNSPAETPQS